ncbi:MAG TPA: hypothetical protein VK797_16420 [Tepidisphaeraceae bacterium]|nr:hypothetical protein [Tepidisphaeraceae bacterium]
MAGESADLYKVRNRETLRRLDTGMEITRATKHEPIAFDSLSNEELRDCTDSRSGSKFLAEWTLAQLTDWTEQQVRLRGWRFPPGVQAAVRFQMPRPVGYVKGKLVRTITIFASGRYVHAFPDEDQDG